MSSSLFPPLLRVRLGGLSGPAIVTSEPAWHRRARAGRQQARQLLHAIEAAAVLSKHHGSQPPGMAGPRNAWNTRKGASSTGSTWTTNRRPWTWCSSCNGNSWVYQYRITSGQATHCQSCGAPWNGDQPAAQPVQAKASDLDTDFLAQIAKECRDRGDTEKADKLDRICSGTIPKGDLSCGQKAAQTLQKVRQFENEVRQAAEAVVLAEAKVKSVKQKLYDASLRLQEAKKAHHETVTNDNFLDCASDMGEEEDDMELDGEAGEAQAKQKAEYADVRKQLEDAKRKHTEYIQKIRGAKKQKVGTPATGTQPTPPTSSGPAASAAASSTPSTPLQKPDEEEVKKVIAEAEGKAKLAAKGASTRRASG